MPPTDDDSKPTGIGHSTVNVALEIGPLPLFFDPDRAGPDTRDATRARLRRPDAS